jgi:phosphohistidine phosphatase SixA
LKVYLIRHSIREVPEDVLEEEDGDPDAKLTDEGEILAEALGVWLGENEEIPSVIYTSPTVRTQQTAEILVKEIGAAGFAKPEIAIDVSIGPNLSIRGLLLKLLDDKSQRGFAIIAHKETILNGLKALSVDSGDDTKVDAPAMCELRILKIKRGSGKWSEKARVRPSDLGLADHY